MPLGGEAGLVEELQHRREMGKAEAPVVSEGQVEGCLAGGLSWPHPWMLFAVLTYHKGRNWGDIAVEGWGAHQRCPRGCIVGLVCSTAAGGSASLQALDIWGQTMLQSPLTSCQHPCSEVFGHLASVKGLWHTQLSMPAATNE